MITISTIKPDEVFDVIHMKLRQTDVDELLAAQGQPAEKTLLESILLSDETYVAKKDGEPFVVFGVGTERTAAGVAYGVPWLLATEDIKKVPLSLLRESRKKVAEWLDKYRFLSNVVASNNKPGISLLRKLGFVVTNLQYELHDPKVPFRMFYMKKPNYEGVPLYV